MPSIFHSTCASPRPSVASSTDSAGDASIGAMNRKSSIAEGGAWSRSTPSSVPAAAGMDPRSMTTRRTSASVLPARSAMARSMTPPRLPCRSEPVRAPAKSARSGAVSAA